jgi:hypothetical protein
VEKFEDAFNWDGERRKWSKMGFASISGNLLKR